MTFNVTLVCFYVINHVYCSVIIDENYFLKHVLPERSFNNVLKALENHSECWKTIKNS